MIRNDVAFEAQTLAHNLYEITRPGHRHVVSGDSAAHRHPAVGDEFIEGSFQLGPLRVVKVDVETFWSGLSEVVARIALAVVESVINLEFAAQVSHLVVRARARNHPAAMHLCELA